jgi:hypothetical protein
VGSGRLGGESLSDPLLDLRTLEKARTYDVSAGSEGKEAGNQAWPAAAVKGQMTAETARPVSKGTENGS